jgi:hypothetical protein
MTTTNFCKRMTVSMKIALDKYAKRLEAEELIIHKDGTITLLCKEGYICERYTPTAKELYK